MSAYRFIEALRGTASQFTLTAQPKWQTVAKSVIAQVSQGHGVKVAEIIGTRRFPRFVDARMAVAVRLRELGWSTPQIGEALHRDHTSVLGLLARARKQ